MHLLEEQQAGGQRRMKAGDSDATIPAAITDVGCERDLNEDRYAVIECNVGVAWIVCDGMGGAAGGELAAQLVIDAVKRDLRKLEESPPDVALRNAIVEANRVIVLRRQNQTFSAMGTTAVGLLFSGTQVALANVGDSRAYLVREGAIQQLTVDHTFVQQLVERGEIRAEEALGHPDAHILTRCLGAEPGLEVDVKNFWVWPMHEGESTDTVLLCSDGLYSLVAEMEIAQIVSTLTPQDACVKLVELAKARGGYDNITVSIIPLAGQLRSGPPPSSKKTKGASPRRSTRASGGRLGNEQRSVNRWNIAAHVFLGLVVSGIVATATILGFFAQNFL